MRGWLLFCIQSFQIMAVTDLSINAPYKRIPIKNAKKKIEFKLSCAGLCPAAVNTKASAGNPPCAVGCKEKDQLGDIFR